MAGLKPISVIGGGLAGLSLGIALRHHNVPVTVWEAGTYPRHRVCGEFISGTGQEVLQKLELLVPLAAAGAIQLARARFVAGPKHSPVRQIKPAIGISRFKLDALLAAEFERLGGNLRQNQRITPAEAPGIVFASGRKPQPIANGWRWFGMKVHARGISLSADLELHIGRNSYVGVNRIDDGLVNVCGLFRSRDGETPTGSRLDLLRGEAGSSLRRSLEHADFDESSFCSVAGLSLRPQRASRQKELCIGDALTMTPPATGNGMSMAFESAEIASGPLFAYSRGEIEWNAARRAISLRCDETFSNRLRWAGLLQRLLLSGIPRTRLGSLLLHSDWIWNLFFRLTR